MNTGRTTRRDFIKLTAVTGTTDEWTADEARNAGRKGGQVSRGGRGRLVVPAGEPTSAPGPTVVPPVGSRVE